MRIISITFLLFYLISCTTEKSSDLDFLIGVWKINGKEKYEEWKKSGNELIGTSYKIVKDKKEIWETLLISIQNYETAYSATVLNQNDGKSVQFVLNSEIDSCFSFENMSHDFPKKIQCKIIEEGIIKVFVKGKDGKGFSYIQRKVYE